MQKHPQGFTLVELIVVITILAILGTIAFISLSGYALTSRDTVRISDINSIVKVIELHRLEEGIYPVVTEPINVTFSGGVIWKQGSFGSGSRIDAGRISEIPIDPLTGSEYAYSVTQATAEYQVGTIIEGALTQQDNQSNLYTFTQQTNAADILSGFATTKIKGNYNGAFITQIVGNSVYVLGAPTILADVISDSTLESIIDTQSFVYEGGNKAPSTYTGTVDNTGSWGFSPAIQGSSSTGVIYEGTTTSLSTGAGKVAFVDNIQSYYENTDVENSKAFIELSNIDTSTTNGANAAQNLVNTYIETEVGGLGDESISVSQGGIIVIVPENGSCGSDNSGNFTRIPLNICSSGTGASMLDGGQGNTYTWNCNGLDGGTNVSCSANHIVSTYPGCNTIDKSIGNYTVSSCNVGTNIAGLSASSYGGHFQFGRNQSYENGTWTTTSYGDDWKSPGGTDAGSANDWGVLEANKSTVTYVISTLSNKVKMRGPCASGYHVPTRKDWNDLRIEGGWGTNGLNMQNALLLPFAGDYSYNGVLQNTTTFGSYWSSSPYGGNAIKFSIYNNFAAAGSAVQRSYGFSIRCFRD